ncbi:hypothetical protein DN062_16235 [Nitrincola tibetensis]|uniref:diguanylate cyclase n=1 Tax=Nitrincola tibetensis TaxID=2219697 RepID=A0A364NID1_9GAMM|nr:GGDEF domain-containing protein [Nitrincola tibetensis]RAU16804.1 hypothetical protein DN062_16235 [Nitrincola tibetensis]
MSLTPHLLDRLASLTSIRDLELLEFSMLKTVHELFRPEQVMMLKYDSDGEVRFTLRYGHNGNYDSQTLRKKLIDEPEVLSALHISRRLKTTYHSKKANGNHISIYPVLDLQLLSVALVVESRRVSSQNDSRVIHALLQIYRNFCQLIEDSQRDQLTGLLNRKTFDDSIQRVIGMSSDRFPSYGDDDRRASVEGEPVYSLGLIDIDNFKQINDTLGHIYGDEVLLLMSQIMRHTFRESDLIFRFGGEEFVVITETDSTETAMVAFERFRVAIDEYAFPQVNRVTVSIGVVEVNSMDVVHTLLDRADKALYYAKNHGKNRVCSYKALLDLGAVKEPMYSSGDIELF